MFGSKPDNLVPSATASAGKFEYSSTATTCEPAPMAYSISVADGDSEMMLVGCASSVRSPTVTGYTSAVTAAVSVVLVEDPPQLAITAVRERKRPAMPALVNLFIWSPCSSCESG